MGLILELAADCQTRSHRADEHIGLEERLYPDSPCSFLISRRRLSCYPVHRLTKHCLKADCVLSQILLVEGYFRNFPQATLFLVAARI